jgi:formate hydrogenlyase transcriptional activator
MGTTLATCQQYEMLLAVAEAIAAHRDLQSLLHDLAGRLREFVRFDHVALIQHDADNDRMQRYAFDHTGPLTAELPTAFAVDDTPAGLVWRTQQPLVLSRLAEAAAWPRYVDRLEPLGANSFCMLPLTTARHRLGTLIFVSRQESAYGDADLDFLGRVAKQVAIAFENALAFARIEELKEQLEKEKVYLEEEIRTDNNFEEIVGESAALRRALKQVETVAPTSSTVLIIGETGTGKELIARAVHQLSPAGSRTFVKLNCAAIPSGLLESELFGHEKGAFTGAIMQKIGRFELAHQGTLFLDEVGDIPAELQPKLLRVLQEQEFERLGSTKTIRVNVRLVAATNRDLPKMVEEGRFRSDLYYRLNVFPIVLPALRQRTDDIPRLVRHLTQKFARRMGRQIETIAAEVMGALVQYHWPGNVRELENVIERAVILSPGTDLQIPISELKPATVPPTNGQDTLADAERQHILRVLRESNWVLSGRGGAAAKLGMKRTTLQSKMKRLGISRPQ